MVAPPTQENEVGDFVPAATGPVFAVVQFGCFPLPAPLTETAAPFFNDAAGFRGDWCRAGHVGIARQQTRIFRPHPAHTKPFSTANGKCRVT
jgi:hypothetical protein